MNELKQCPFCGGAMKLTHDHTIEDIDSIRHALPSINCPIEGASGFCVGNDQLVAAWNTRDTSFAERAVKLALERAADVAADGMHDNIDVAGVYAQIRSLSTPEAIAGLVKEASDAK